MSQSSSHSVKTEKKDKPKKDKGKKKDKKKPKWKRVLNKMREKSRERWKQISATTKESKIGQLFQSWTKKHHLSSSNQADAAILLQKQLEDYQAQIEHRKNRVPGENSGHLREGDDTIPYEQQPISMSWIATEESSSDSDSSSQSSDDTGAPKVAAKQQETSSTRSSAKVEAKQQETSSTRSSVSTSTTSTSEDLSERTGQLSCILKAIVSDTRKRESIRKEDEENLQLPPVKLALMSRKELEKFEKILEENTKQSLFVSQPTAEERRFWNERKSRPQHMSTPAHQVKIVTETIEARIFCHSCIPRHENYPHKKQSTRIK